MIDYININGIFAFCKPRTWCSLVPGILQLSSSWGPGSSRKPVMSCLSAEEEIPRWVISSDVAVEIRSDWAKRLWFDLPNRNSLQKSKKHKETSKIGGRSKAVFTVLLIGFSPSLEWHGLVWKQRHPPIHPFLIMILQEIAQNSVFCQLPEGWIYLILGAPPSAAPLHRRQGAGWPDSRARSSGETGPDVSTAGPWGRNGDSNHHL